MRIDITAMGKLPALLLAAMLVVLPGPGRADHQSGHEDAGPSALDALRDLASGLAGNDAPTFLDPELAFVLSARPMDPGAATVSWRIADGYYLYRERIVIEPLDSPHVSMDAPQLPQGKIKEDPYFGRQQVYYEGVQARVPLRLQPGAPREVSLQVTYQGCADAGLCYPPITKVVALAMPSLPAAGAASSAPVGAPAGELPEQDRLARALATGDTPLVLLAFFGLGLLLTFTPCVLPMIPILSSIIVGQGPAITTARAFSLSLVYVLAMAATYTAAGVAAGLSGANLQAAFQNPWVLGSFSALFVLLALSMFGLYTLQVPLWLQQRLNALSHRQRGGTYAGVGVMGFLSALIVGPCVAAPLAGALIYIARTGDAVLGGAALFALSLGMGVPVLIVGTSAGRLLPRVGPWMSAVKALFGAILLGVAIYLLERLVPVWASMALWGTLFVGLAVYLATRGRGDAATAPGRGPAWVRALGVVSLAYGAVLMVGAATGGHGPLEPLSGLRVTAGHATAELPFLPVKGVTGLEAALREARLEGRPVMLDFYADWCVSCKELERDTFADAQVQAALSDAVLLRTDVTRNDTADQALLERFGLFGPPAVLFFGADGVERSQFRVVGFMKPLPFRDQAERAFAGSAAAARAPRPAS
jgi:thiol:disulfide interchange protein DsbD